MSFATGQKLRVRAAAATFEARVLLGGDEHDVVLDVEGAGGVHRFERMGKRWRAADEARWTHGDVDLEPVEGAAAAKAAGARRRTGW